MLVIWWHWGVQKVHRVRYIECSLVLFEGGIIIVHVEFFKDLLPKSLHLGCHLQAITFCCSVTRANKITLYSGG